MEKSWLMGISLGIVLVPFEKVSTSRDGPFICPVDGSEEMDVLLLCICITIFDPRHFALARSFRCWWIMSILR